MIISIIQIVISILLVIVILLQERGSGAGGLFGGSEGGAYQQRRGMEKGIFGFTIILVVAYAGLAVYSLIAPTL